MNEIEIKLAPTEIIKSDLSTNPPARFLVIPYGEVRSVNGHFIFDKESADKVLAIFHQKKVDMVIDYNHGSMKDLATNDGKSIAAGWITHLDFVENEGLFATVKWTDRALELLKSGEYRYSSPTVWVHEKTRRVVEMDSLALTHKPAIEGGLPVAFAQNKKRTSHTHKEHGNMNGEVTTTTTDGDPSLLIGAIMEKLGIKLDGEFNLIASLKSIHDSIPEKKKASDGDAKSEGEAEAVPSSVLSALKLTKDADCETAVTMINSVMGSKTTVEQLTHEVSELKKNMASNERGVFLQPYIDKGVINPKTGKDFYNAVCSAYDRNPEDAKVILQSRVDMMPSSGSVVSQDAPAASGDRATVIANATAEYKGDESLQKLCNQSAHVNMKLEEGEHGLLDEDETKKLVG